MNPEKTRTCRTCGIEKPLTEYHQRKGKVSDKQTKCKKCFNQQRRIADYAARWAGKGHRSSNEWRALTQVERDTFIDQFTNKELPQYGGDIDEYIKYRPKVGVAGIARKVILELEDITEDEWDEMSDEDKKWFQDKHAIAIAHAIASAFKFNPTNEESPKAPIPDIVRTVAERLMEEQREETGTRGKQAKHKTGFIYLVRLPEHPEYVKAGRTVDGDSRLRTYHNAHPLNGHEMVFVGFVNNYKGAEEELLKRLKPYLHKGEEWFKVDINHAIDVILDIYRSDEFGIPEILALPDMGLKFDDDDKEAA